MILVDTNVIVDILGDDPVWARWSSDALDRAAAADVVAIDEIVYAELSAGYRDAQSLESDLGRLRLPLIRMPREAFFLAGATARRYRAAGGAKLSVLPDFFIGAHAAIEQAPLLTRDTRHIRTYFPSVRLISPDTA